MVRKTIFQLHKERRIHEIEERIEEHPYLVIGKREKEKTDTILLVL